MKTFVGVVAGTVVGCIVFLIIGGVAKALGGLGGIALTILAIVGGIKAGSSVYTKISGKIPKQYSFFKKKESGQTPKTENLSPATNRDNLNLQDGRRANQNIVEKRRNFWPVVLKYLPDLLLFIGVFALSVGIFREPCYFPFAPRSCSQPIWPIIIGIMLLVFATDVIVRRYFTRLPNGI